MKNAFLLSYSLETLINVTHCQVADDFENGDDVYGDKVPFAVGSNQIIRVPQNDEEREHLENLSLT